MKELKELKEKIKNIEVTYDYEETYSNLYNVVTDYMNDTQDWDFEYLFENYIDEEILKEMIKYKIDQEGIWSVNNLLSGIENYDNIYFVDVYGYGRGLTKEDLENLKDEILTEIDRKINEM